MLYIYESEYNSFEKILYEYNNAQGEGIMDRRPIKSSLIFQVESKWRDNIPIKLPLFIGDTIHVEQVVREMREGKQKDRGLLTFEKEVINQRNEVVQTGTTTVLLAKRCYKREG